MQGRKGVISALPIQGSPDLVLVKWNAATDNATPSNLVEYDIYSSLNRASVFQQGRVSTAKGVTQAVIGGLPAGGRRSYFGVRARDYQYNQERNRVTVRGPVLTSVSKWTDYK